jgi:hypothetical protein
VNGDTRESISYLARSRWKTSQGYGLHQTRAHAAIAVFPLVGKECQSADIELNTKENLSH